MERETLEDLMARQAMIETVVAVALAHLAVHKDDALPDISSVLADTEIALGKMAAGDHGADVKPIGVRALGALHRMGNRLIEIIGATAPGDDNTRDRRRIRRRHGRSSRRSGAALVLARK